jgi:hypothetical protein
MDCCHVVIDLPRAWHGHAQRTPPQAVGIAAETELSDRKSRESSSTFRFTVQLNLINCSLEMANIN